MHSTYVACLIDTMNYLSSKGITSRWANAISSNIFDAREVTLSGSAEYNYNDSRPFQGTWEYKKLFWIDSDISWKPEDFLKLYESDYDVISGCCRLAFGSLSAYKERYKPILQPEDIKGLTEPFEIASCGFGFVAFKQGVFETLKRPWFGTYMGKAPIGENGELKDFEITAEDTALFYKVVDNGFKIYLDPTVHTYHWKTIPLGVTNG
jgi:hypothetical protein